MNEIWRVRAGHGAAHVGRFESESVIAIGWRQMGDLTERRSKPEIRKWFRSTFPDESKAAESNQVGQIVRFMNDMAVGDQVVTYDPDRRLYLLGTVESDCLYRPDLIPDPPNIRRVSWSSGIPRDSLSVSTKNSLGSIMTIFRLNDEASKELRSKSVPVDELVGSEDEPMSVVSSKSEEQRISEQEMRVDD